MKCQGSAIWYDLNSMPELYSATACSPDSMAVNSVLAGGKLEEKKMGARLMDVNV